MLWAGIYVSESNCVDACSDCVCAPAGIGLGAIFCGVCSAQPRDVSPCEPLVRMKKNSEQADANPPICESHLVQRKVIEI